MTKRRLLFDITWRAGSPSQRATSVWLFAPRFSLAVAKAAMASMAQYQRSVDRYSAEAGIFHQTASRILGRDMVPVSGSP